MLYRFTTDHEAGNWNAAHAVQVVLSADVAEAKKEAERITNALIENGYLNDEPVLTDIMHMMIDENGTVHVNATYYDTYYVFRLDGMETVKVTAGDYFAFYADVPQNNSVAVDGTRYSTVPLGGIKVIPYGARYIALRQSRVFDAPPPQVSNPEAAGTVADRVTELTDAVIERTVQQNSNWSLYNPGGYYLIPLIYTDFIRDKGADITLTFSTRLTVKADVWFSAAGDLNKIGTIYAGEMKKTFANALPTSEPGAIKIVTTQSGMTVTCEIATVKSRIDNMNTILSFVQDYMYSRAQSTNPSAYETLRKNIDLIGHPVYMSAEEIAEQEWTQEIGITEAGYYAFLFMIPPTGVTVSADHFHVSGQNVFGLADAANNRAYIAVRFTDGRFAAGTIYWDGEWAEMVSFRATDLTADVLEGQIDRVKEAITTGDTIVSGNRLTTGSMNATGVKVTGSLWSIHMLDVTAIPTGTEIHITTKTLDYSGAGTALWSYKATNAAADAGISTGEYVHPTAAEEVTLKTVKPDGGNYLFVCVSSEAYTEGYRPSVLIVKPINEEVGALKNELSELAESKMNKHLLDYDSVNKRIYDGDHQLTFAELHTMLMDETDFVVLVYEDEAYHPMGVSDTKVVFSSISLWRKYGSISTITMTSNGNVSLVDDLAERQENKVQEITDANKDHAYNFPSVPAVVSALAPLKTAISQLQDALIGVDETAEALMEVVGV